MMEKTPVCRICLAVADDVHMFVVVNETLHELYEKLTDIPFETEDSRPILACFICCAQLKKCYRFMKKCLDAEEQFAKMMMVKEEYEIKPLINQDQFELFHGFIRTPIDTISIVDVDQTESIVVKEELPAVCERLDDVIEINEEHESDDDIKTVNIYDKYLDVEDAPSHHSESDSEDDVPLLEVKKEGEAEKTSRPPAVKKQETDTRRTELTDIITTKQKKEDPIMIRDNQNHTSESNIAKHQKVQNVSRRNLGLSQHGDTGENRYKCDFCQRSFKCKHTLFEHIIREHPGEKPFKCDVCQYSAKEKDALKQHRLTHGENPFKCDICSDTFRYKSRFTQHQQTHSSEKPFQCDVCQKRFKTLKGIRAHHQVHTDEKSYTCDICQSTFKNKSDLRKHILRHTNENPLKCDVCQYSAKEKDALKQHRLTHGENPFKCDICSDTFRYKSRFTQHIRIHTGEKPYKCNICECSFREKKMLTQHQQTHSSEKPFQCDVCQKRFKTLKSIRAHHQVHTDEKSYTCDICQSTFKNKSDLRKHILRHTNEKLKCDICQRIFRHNSTLRKHVIKHTAGNYQCQICRCNFSRETALKQHMFLEHTPNLCI